MWIAIAAIIIAAIAIYVYFTKRRDAAKTFYNDDYIVSLMVGDMFGSLSWHSPYSINGKTDFEILKSYIKPGSVVLDFGCGVGGTAIRLAKELNCTVYGLNISEKQKAIMDREIEHHKLENQVFCVLYDGATFPAFSCKFDTVIFQESMCHVQDKQRAMKQLKNVLKPNGTLFGQDWFKLKDSHSIFIQNTDHYYATKLETPQAYIHYLHTSGFTNVKFIDLKSQTTDLNPLFPKNTDHLRLNKNNPVEMGGAAMSKAFHNGEFTIGLLIAHT
jgi:SAM-dependent methyltransferase